MRNNKKHLVVSVGGGPLSFIYGTPTSSPEQVASDIKELYRKIGATSLEIICVDPNTEVEYTPDLDPHEAGFKEPVHVGEGWNAKVYEIDLEGKIIAGMHQYCGSSSTNLNDGVWQRDTPNKYVELAVDLIQRAFPDLKVIVKTYRKPERVGKVDKRLQDLTKTNYPVK
jgi:hypothetical protein